MKRALLLFLGLLLTGEGHADSLASFHAPDTVLHPENGASTRDEIYILYAQNACKPNVDPLRPPVVQQQGGRIEVSLYLVDIDPLYQELCRLQPILLSLERFISVPLGRFAMGKYEVDVLKYLRPFDSTEYTLVEDRDGTEGVMRYLSFEVRDTPNPAISGAWYDRSAPGWGVFLNLVPKREGEREPLAFLILNTVDSEGGPTWLFGTGTFSDARLDIPLTRGGSNRPEGRVMFEYLGCGRARLSVSGVDLPFPKSAAALEQLTTTLDVGSCSPPLYRADSPP